MKNVLKVIVNVLAWIILVLALLITIIVFSSERNNGVANLFGYIPLTVESDSMKPTFSQGDLIFCKEVDDVNALAEGDVITFWTIIDGKRVKNTHRIVGINQAENSRSFVTRGDANTMDDTMPAYAGDIIGKWTEKKLGGMGKAMNFLRTKTGFFVCIIIPMAIFFLFELYKFIATLIEVRRPAAEEIDEEEIKRRAVEEYLAAQKQAAENAAAEAKPEETKPEAPAAEVKAEPEAPSEEPKPEPEAKAEPEVPAEEAKPEPETSENAENTDDTDNTEKKEENSEG